MLRRLAPVAAGALVAFHAWIFANLLLQGRIATPDAVFKWLAAFLLLVALGAASRTVDRVQRRRQMVALWTLAALLHAPAAIERLDELEPLAAPPLAVLTELGPTFFAILLATAIFAGHSPLASAVLRAPLSASPVSRGPQAPKSAPDAPRPPPELRIFSVH